MKIRHHLIESMIHNRYRDAVQNYLLIKFNVRFKKQVMIVHRVAYYLHSRQAKTSLSQLHHIEIINFMQ